MQTFELTSPLPARDPTSLAPGALISVRGAVWRVAKVERDASNRIIYCRGVSGIVRGKEGIFIERLEPDLQVLEPSAIELVPDGSAGFQDTKLFLEAAFRSTPPSGSQPLTLGKAAIDDLAFQHNPVTKALGQSRLRLLLADDVGLGKTLEAGLIASELILRRRAARILVVSTRAMLNQFQKEFWTRFAIPLVRLDSAAIRKIRNEIPAHYNVFDQFERAIVSIDTLKKDMQYRQALEESRWDLIIIDEAHNAAQRAQLGGSESLRARLAKLLSRRADSLLLLTATPHDGSQDSFASLVEMLDPTRVPNAAELKREDIEDLVIRRFRFSKEVVETFKTKVPERRVTRRDFRLTHVEDAAYALVADLKLDLDEADGKKRGIDLFRTTLAKAIFSSPAACLETVEGRIRRIKSGQAKGSAHDIAALSAVADGLEQIGPSDFTKYQDLLKLLKDIKWSPRNRRDRIVIFSERIRTLQWLEDRLRADLGLSEEAIGRIDGGSLEADARIQKVLEDFGQETAPIRVLLASDMASEGLNLHFQCHRLIHFDLPWSLLRFQQRNGRIDRYGQDRTPEICYFVGESAHPRVRDMWVLDKLVEKDQAAQIGVGDPAVFLGVGDPVREEAVVAEAVAKGIGAEAFGRAMDDRVAHVAARIETDDGWGLLFGEYSNGDAETSPSLADAPAPAPMGIGLPPRLFPDTFSYTREMLVRLSRPEEGIFATPPVIRDKDRIIEFLLPEDMKATDNFGYSRQGNVDERYMPVEAVGKGGRIELTDSTQAVNEAIRQARGDERAWPQVQYLWDVHPILEWLNDRAANFFGRRAAPVCRLEGRLAPGEIALLIHGAVPNQVGAPVVDVWGVVTVKDGRAGEVMDVGDFLDRVGLRDAIPNRGNVDLDAVRASLPPAVDRFQTRLVNLRVAKAIELDLRQADALGRLAALEGRFHNQLELDFGEGEMGPAASPLQARRRARRRDDRRVAVREMFDDWSSWFRDTCELVDEPHPFVDIKAVFQG
jgi:superfamily II DNA or RNA helicase